MGAGAFILAIVSGRPKVWSVRFAGLLRHRKGRHQRWIPCVETKKKTRLLLSIHSVSFMEYIYVLELEQNKYYVGKTIDIEHRIKKHLNGGGSVWTKTYKPTGRYRIIKPGDNPYKLKEVTESTVTYHLMLKFGYENVRGSGWSAFNLKKPPNQPRNYAPL